MPTLLLRLKGPMQSWGTRSRFDTRDTESEPSKSGVLGLICAAMGISRDNWEDLEPLTSLQFGVRIDDPGTIRRDYHTAMDVAIANAKGDTRTAVTNRYYLADASFLVGLAGDDKEMLQQIKEAIDNPVWQIFLGRKSFLPSESITLPDGMINSELLQALEKYPYEVAGFRKYDLKQKNIIAEDKDEAVLTIKLETKEREGAVYMDQPLAPFSERKFGRRYVVSSTVTKEVLYTNNKEA